MEHLFFTLILYFAYLLCLHCTAPTGPDVNIRSQHSCSAGESIDQFREQVIAKKGGGKGLKGLGNHWEPIPLKIRIPRSAPTAKGPKGRKGSSKPFSSSAKLIIVASIVEIHQKYNKKSDLCHVRCNGWLASNLPIWFGTSLVDFWRLGRRWQVLLLGVAWRSWSKSEEKGANMNPSSKEANRRGAIVHQKAKLQSCWGSWEVLKLERGRWYWGSKLM